MITPLMITPLQLDGLALLQNISDLLNQLRIKNDSKQNAINTFAEHLITLEQLTTCITDEV